MPVSFPDYYEFESINLAYRLNPNTRPMLEDIWRFMTDEHTLLKCAPEGLLMPCGYKDIQRRMGEVRYLVIVPKELSEEIRRVMKTVLGNNSGPGGNANRENPEVEQPRYLLEDCIYVLNQERERERPNETRDNERRQEERPEEDPLPGIGSPWPWDVQPHTVTEMPSTGSGQVSIPTGQGAGQPVMKTIIHTYDYFGQYFSSVMAFCSIMARIPGRTNYQRTLTQLEIIVNQSEDSPLIVICPENVEIAFRSMPNIFADGIFDPANPDKLYEFGLKKVFIHEMGHHLFPVHYRENDPSSEYWPECMANWFAYHLMNEKERLGLYVWTLRQPLQYRSYLALLGLSMRNDSMGLLTEIIESDRKKLITGSELACRKGENPENIQLAQKLIWHRSFYSYSPRRYNRMLPRRRLLLTPAEVMWQMLIDWDFYNELTEIFFELNLMRRIRIDQVPTSVFNRMVKRETERKPINEGYLRSGGSDLDFVF